MPRDESVDAQETAEVVEDNDVMEMSDEDFLNASESSLSTINEPEEGDDKEVEEEPTDVDQPDEEPAIDGDEEDEATGGLEVTEDQPEDGKEEQPEPEDTFDYKAEYQKLMQPIKASGRTVQMKSTDQIINRIQLAEDYNKKMTGMRPHMATLKTLEKQGLLAPDKVERLNLLLELDGGNPDALKRFIAESDIDILDLADDDVAKQNKEYVPDNHIMSEREVEIGEALNSISGSDKYQQTLDVMTKEFDPKSRDIISEHPEYIGSLNQDIESGVYDNVMEHVRYRKEMNLLPSGMSDMEAYIDTVQHLAANEQQQMQQQQEQQAEPKTSKATKKRRNSMSSSKSASTNRKQKEYDPLETMEMSDEDFMKLYNG